MNPKLFARISKAVEKAAKEYKWTHKITRGVLSEVKEDPVLPILNLRTNARITINEDEEGDIFLVVGPRDFQFEITNVGTAELAGCGTVLNSR